MYSISISTIIMTTSENRIFEYYSFVQAKQIKWLWYPYIPFGKLTIVQGDPGDGKSTFILDIISRLTNGIEMSDGFQINDKYNVIYQCFEDDVSDTIKPRLISAGANCSKVAYILNNGDFLSLDDKRIELTIQNTNAKLLVLDPIQSFLQESELNTIGKIRTILGNLVQLANKYTCAIVLIGHLNKSNNSKNIYRGLGSIDISAIARSILMIERDEENPTKRYMYPVKSSLAVEGNCIEFKITNNNKIKWLNIKKMKKRTSCGDILIDLLSYTPMQSSKIIEIIKNKGFSERTINSEKKKLGITSYRKNKQWFWELPDNNVFSEAI